MIKNGSFEGSWSDIVADHNAWLLNQEPEGWELEWTEIGANLPGSQDKAVGVPECVHKFANQLPPDEQLGAENALILDGEVVYKIFNSGAAFSASLRQSIEAEPGTKLRFRVPVQVHKHGDLDYYAAEVGLEVDGDISWFQFNNEQKWEILRKDFVMGESGIANLGLIFKSKWNKAKDFFVDDVRVKVMEPAPDPDPDPNPDPDPDPDPDPTLLQRVDELEVRLNNLTNNVLSIDADLELMDTQIKDLASKDVMILNELDILGQNIGNANGLILEHINHHPSPKPDPEPSKAVPDWAEYYVDLLVKHEMKEYTSRDLSEIERVVIHHTATTSDEVDAIFASANYHVDNNNWPGIGYHYCITGPGYLYQVNDLETISFHAGGTNNNSIGIALMGNFNNKWPKPSQLEALSSLIEFLKAKLGKDLEIVQHREVSQTACPGNTVNEWWDQIEVPDIADNIWQDSLESQELSLNFDATLLNSILEDGFTPIGNEHSFDKYVYQAAMNFDSAEPVRAVYYVIPPNYDEVFVVFEDSVPDPPNPAPSGLDMGDYFYPLNGRKYGDIITLRNNWGENEERVQLIGEGATSYITKNQLVERRVLDEEYVYLNLDTSYSVPEYYVVEGPWIPRKWNPGEEFTNTVNIDIRMKGDCQRVAYYPQESTKKFVARHAVWQGEGASATPVNDVIEIGWVVNGALIESMYFGRGLGLVGWKQHQKGLHSYATKIVSWQEQEPNTVNIPTCAK